MPLAITLIMPTLNAQNTIAEALESVAAQRYSGNVEVIVADGGSNDNTLETARRYDFVRLLSGGDNSIYEGYNRGIHAAEGEIIGFFNADDILATGTLNIIAKAFDVFEPPRVC